MSDLADEYDTGISNPGAGGASDGVFMTSLRMSDGEPPISSSEPTMHNTTAAAAKESPSGAASVIASSENPLHSPSESEYDPEDVADLLSAEDGFGGSGGAADTSGLGDTGKYSGSLLSDSLLGQNPLVTPSDSPGTSELGESSGGGAEMRGLRLDLDEGQEEQAARREELESYMGELQSREDEDGQPSVVMPADFSRMVSDILSDIRPKEGEKDWLTVAREDAAAAAEKNASKLKEPGWTKLKTEDPMVLQALDEAIALDKRLREKQIESMIAWRETHPDEWEAQRQKKEEQRLKKAEAAIKAERKRRQHQARLQRALNVVESFDKGDHMGRNAQLGPDARYFKLQPEEEELVEKLLQEEEPEEDTPGDAHHSNPFELQIVPLEGAENPGFDLARDTVKKLADIDMQLSGLAQDHLFDETGSLVDFRSSVALGDGRAAGSISHRPPSAITSYSDLDVQSMADGPAPSVAPSSVAAPPPSVSKASSKGRRPKRPQSGTSEAPSGSSRRAPSEISERSRVVQDYLTEQRLQREAAEREKDLDARLRQLRVSELPDPRAIPDIDLKALIADCRRAQEARDAHVDAINRLEAPAAPPSLLIPPGTPEAPPAPSPGPSQTLGAASGGARSSLDDNGSGGAGTFVTSGPVPHESTASTSLRSPMKAEAAAEPKPAGLGEDPAKQSPGTPSKSARRPSSASRNGSGGKIVWRSPPSPARPPSTDPGGPSFSTPPASPSAAKMRRNEQLQHHHHHHHHHEQQQSPEASAATATRSRPTSSHGLPPASPSSALRTSAAAAAPSSSSPRIPSARARAEGGGEQSRPQSSSSSSSRQPTRSLSSSSGPTRSLAERQRRTSESASIPLFVPGEGLQADASRVILHHHSAAPGSAGAPAAAGMSSTQTTPRPGRRSRDGSAGRRPQSAEKEGLVVEPVPRGASPAAVDPLQDLGAEKASIQRVASAGRRAGLVVASSRS